MNQSLLQLASRCRGEALKDKAAAANMKLRIQQLEQQAANDESEIVGLRCVGLEVLLQSSGWIVGVRFCISLSVRLMNVEQTRELLDYISGVDYWFAVDVEQICDLLDLMRGTRNHPSKRHWIKDGGLRDAQIQGRWPKN